jgi:hypothetical protein
MRRTLTSVIALGFAIGSGSAVLADDNDNDNEEIAAEVEIEGDLAEDRERFETAGFEGAQVMHGLEVARVTHDGETFFVVKGLDRAMGPVMDHGMQQAMPGEMPETAQPGAVTEPGMDVGQPGTEVTPGMEDDVAADPAAPGADEPGADIAADPAAPGADEPGADIAADPAAPGADEPAADMAADPAAPGMADPAAPGADVAADPAAPGADAMAQAEGWEARSLEDILAEAGIEEYEILDDVRVATVRMGEGMDAGEVVVFFGFDDDEEDTDS